MRILRVVMAVACVVFLCAGVARAEAPAGDAAVAAVEELEHARQHAMVAADIATLVEIFADDFTYVHSTGLAQSKDELLAMLTRGDIQYIAFRTESAVYRAYGSTVVGTGVQSIDLTSSGKALTSRSRYTVVYAPVRGALRLVSYQSTPMPEIVLQQTVGDRKAP
ncbi:MAG TPA: nuclear transport factor 2 family protein [Candidatus Krumholzibacteria bacterium]|nr:nuclear transport factor 2 family protein [Candidatus Krumholzibacteria bacterium]